MEFAGVNPLGSMAALAVEAPLRKARSVTRIAASGHAQGASTDGQKRPDQGRAAEARDLAALRHEIERRALPVGPSPAFKMNLLEAENGLEQVLARIEAARNHDRESPALRPSGPDPGAPPSAAAISGATPAAIESPGPHAPAVPVPSRTPGGD